MSAEALRTTGFSGDLGWNEADDAPMGGLDTALLVVASGAVWGSLWLLTGLPPLSSATNWVQRQSHVAHQTSHHARLGKKQA